MIQFNNRNLIDDAGDEYTILAYTKKSGNNQDINNYTETREIFSSCAGAALYKKSIIEEIGYFDDNFFAYMEDVDLSRRCAEKYGAIYYPQAYVTHFHEQGSHKNKTLLKAHLKSAYQYFNKWGWFFDSGRQKINKDCLDQLQ